MGPLHEWMPEQLWPKIKALEGLKQFSGLGDAMHSDSDDWLRLVRRGRLGVTAGGFRATGRRMAVSVHDAVDSVASI